MTQAEAENHRDILEAVGIKLNTPNKGPAHLKAGQEKTVESGPLA
jgi:hypothetical protein